MRIFYIAKRVFKDEKGVLLLFLILFLLPLMFAILVPGRLIKNLAVLFLAIPILLYPIFFFIRGIWIIGKEWQRGTVYIYKTNPVSAFEYETGYILYAAFEILFFIALPIVFIFYLSHGFKTLLEFTPSWGTFFVYFPLFLLSYLFGRFLFLFSRSIYRYRNVLTFLVGIVMFTVFLRIYMSVSHLIPAPFKLTFVTDSVHVSHIGSFAFVYALLWVLPIFSLNLFLWTRAES